MLEPILQSLFNILTPMNFLLLFIAVIAGMVLGAIPGLGGITGLTILLPFVFGLEPAQAMILLVGLAAVVTTGDTIPAVLFGIPGTAGAQATILDGFPMAKRGEAARALGAGYMSSMLGGLFSALVLLLSLPILKPLVLALGSPELFLIAVFGLSLVSTLTERSPAIGLSLALMGLVISMIGQDAQTGVFRWTFGQPYLLEGIPILPAILGVFAVPDLIELVVRGKPIASSGTSRESRRGIFIGVRDTLANWFLVLRCSVIGTVIGAIPGLGADVVPWFAYAHTKQTARNAEQLGHGDVRGVIGPEAANNAKTGGSLIPTIAFGVPGSIMMVILLGAFTMAGVAPGPAMLSTHLEDVTLPIVWALMFSNILATAVGMALGHHAAKLCHAPIQMIAPFVLVAVGIAALQATAYVADLIVLFVFGLIGWGMKTMEWSRPPLLLGMILGPIIQKYLFISISSYGVDWMWRPGVLVLAVLLVASLGYNVWAGQGRQEAEETGSSKASTLRLAGALAVLLFFAAALWTGRAWPGGSWFFLQAIAVPGLALAGFELWREMKERWASEERPAVRSEAEINVAREAAATVLKDAQVFVWLLGYIAGVWALGAGLSSALLVFFYVRFVARARLTRTVLAAGLTYAFVWGLLIEFFQLTMPEGVVWRALF